MRLPRSTLLWIPVVGIGVGFALWAQARLAAVDATHDRFLETGRSIKAFLSAYCEAVEEAHAAGSVEPLAALVSPGYASPGRGAWAFGPAREEGGATVAALRAPGGADFDRARLLDELRGYLGGLSAVEGSKCKVDLVESIDPPGTAVLTVKYVLDGTDRQGLRIQDRLFLRWHLVQEGSMGVGHGWRIARDELVEGVRVAGDGRAFQEADPAALGIGFVHRRDPALDPEGAGAAIRFALIQHAAGGVAAADVSGDGRPDLFFADGVDSRLYRNEGPGPDGLPRFADVTEAAGLAGIDRAFSGLFGDVDGDGDLDLFVARYLARSRLYLNRGDGRFEDRTDDLVGGLEIPATSATFLDHDRDGDLDLYVAAYGDAFREIPRLPFFARNGGPNRLLENDGTGRFTDVTAASGTGDTGWSLAVAAGDYDGDGWPDLAVANDAGRKTLYRNQGDGTFRDRAKEAGVLDFGLGMGVAFGDVDGDGDADLYTANIKSNQRWYGEELTLREYMRNVLTTRWAVLDLTEYAALYRLLGDGWRGLGKQLGEGNSLLRNEGDGTFAELRDSHTNQAGWGWGVAFFDYDHDRDLDIYAANGWISARPDTDL